MHGLLLSFFVQIQPGCLRIQCNSVIKEGLLRDLFTFLCSQFYYNRLKDMETGNYSDLRAVSGTMADSSTMKSSKNGGLDRSEFGSDLKDSTKDNLKDTCSHDSGSESSQEENVFNRTSNDQQNIFKCYKCWGIQSYGHNDDDKCPECKGTGFIPSSHSMVAIFERLLLLKLPMLKSKETIEKTFSDQIFLSKFNLDSINTFDEEQGFHCKKEVCPLLRKISEEVQEADILYNQRKSLGNEITNDNVRSPAPIELCSFQQFSSVSCYDYEAHYQKQKNLFHSFGDEPHYPQHKIRFERMSKNPEQKIKNAQLECSFQVPPIQMHRSRNYKPSHWSANDLDNREGQNYVFFNYQCDMCEMTPLVNKRIHCEQCLDYDLCERCYLTNAKSHQHNHFTVIDGSYIIKNNKFLVKRQSQTMHFIESHESIQ